MKSTSLPPTQIIQMMKKKNLNKKRMAIRRDFNCCTENMHYTVCPKKSWSILFGNLPYKLGQYFLDIQYI